MDVLSLTGYLLKNKLRGQTIFVELVREEIFSQQVCTVSVLVPTAVTKYHELGILETTGIFCPLFWSLNMKVAAA